MTPLAGIRHQVRILVEEGHVDAAVEMARAAVPMFPSLSATTALWLADILCQAGREDRAIATLSSASAHGSARERGVIENDPYLAPLRGGELDHILQASETILEGKQRRLRPVPPSIVLPRKAPRGVLLCLHGRADRASPGTARSWRAALSTGFALVIPQSTRLTVWPDRLFGWTDPDEARREIESAWQTAIVQTPRLGELPVVIGGLSIGADIGIDIALAGCPLRARGFIGVAPPGREIQVRDVPVYLRPMYGTIVVGIWDYRRQPALRLWDELTAAGVATEFVGIARVGHAMPPQATFAPRLRLALLESLRHVA